MDRIVFYNGEETGHVLETDCFQDSLFREQYSFALKLFKSIYSSQGPVSNIIAFCGDRGEGKTSCMRSFMELLKNDSELHKFESILPFKADDVEILDVIDPAFFDKKHNLIELVLGQMYGKIAGKSIQDADYSAKLNERNNLLRYFQKAKRHLGHLEKEKRELYDELEELDALSAGVKLEECIGLLFEEYLKFQNKKKIVLAIDDLDLNMTEGYKMAEQIRKYLNHKSCILLIGLNVSQLSTVIQNSIAKELKTSPSESPELSVMASKYVMKVIPYGNRVLMPSIGELCNMKLQICRRGDALKELKDLNSVKDEVTRLIFMKTRYLFYNEKGSVSPIVPMNLRSLRLLLGMLMHMEDFEDNKSHSGNKRIFKSYFFNEWTKCLDSHQDFIKDLLDYRDLSGINMFVINYFKDIRYKLDINLFDIDIESEYDVSLGYVLKTLSYIYNANSDNETKKLIFFLRSFYSMKLYELYDVISETEGGIYPSVISDDAEVVKVDTVFKNVNQLQKLLNGSYFRYEQNSLLAPKLKKYPRDLHSIDGKAYNALLKNVAAGLTKFNDIEFADDNDSDEAKEWRAFKQNFRMCEFFMLTTLRSLPFKDRLDVSNYFVSPDASVPAYMTEYHQNMGFYLFDIMAPFYNVVNIQYAYLRFAEIGNLYEFALNHKWSLLRSMMDRVYDDRAKTIVEEGKNYTDVAMHCLVSDAVIRNTDVHSAIMETMQTNRFKIKETGETTLLLEKTYTALTKIGMKTYYFSEGKAHEIRFAFLNAITDFLKETDNTVFEDIFFPKAEEPAGEGVLLSEENSQWLDEKYPSLVNRKFHLVGKTIIAWMRKDMSADFINNLRRGFFQEFIQNNKKYQSWEEVKQALAGVMGQLKEAEFHTLPDDPAEAE